MGDKKRFEVLADYIEENYPAAEYRRVLDVAGGGGCLALELADRGYIVEVVDPRRTLPPKKVRRAKRNLMGMITRRQEPFQATMAKEADLVVALHPDGATEQAALASEFCPVVIMPCCNYWAGHEGDVTNAVREVFGRLRGVFSEIELPITGRNILLEAR